MSRKAKIYNNNADKYPGDIYYRQNIFLLILLQQQHAGFIAAFN